MTRQVFLIRAINVGGAKLPMAELREIAADLGATDIATHIASGNLLAAPPDTPEQFARALESAIQERYGFYREVIGRTAEQLRDAVDAYPFVVDEEKFAHIYFLTGTPTADASHALVDKDFGDDELVVIGADLHIRYANGVAGTKLTAPVIARTLGVQGTGRNLRTVRTLITLVE
ncbi:DUF1697 domain-containing protein [Gordonia sp. NB41Y]|uniref:DUF1697 domain-containing protein n=1 Tax=Gordonia sp. NB41Y TaxID=875808 RepID=UPI0002BE10DB|nr:DUF1697 domain-containing protein [Gordonia sp. NB41Y]EMP12751.1 hypothetical protein ISGA_1822 [Gordonia sp. NB41Y]WLP88829.1 DUF1697 domain-containing protein [Gordonia sp. NB41Y]